MIARSSVVSVARTWIGTKYAHQASLRGVATDCIGLILGVARELGIAEASEFAAATRYQGYSQSPNSALLREAVARFLDPVERAQPGDVLLMRFKLEPQHFGILSAPDYVIHAYARSKRVIEHRIDELWSSRIVSAHAFRGVS